VKKGPAMMLQRVVFAFLSFLCVSATPYAYGAGMISQFHPFVSVKGEYNDNLNLTKTNKNEDYVTTVQPGIRFSNMSQKTGVDLEYTLGAVFYGKKTNLNYISHNASLNAKYMTASHINFYLKESFIRSDEPREQEYFTTTADNRSVLSTKTERAVYWRNVAAPTSTTVTTFIERTAQAARTVRRITSIPSFHIGLTNKTESPSNTALPMEISIRLRT
jgi:hypothetical protein